jgi:hypothetical protein
MSDFACRDCGKSDLNDAEMMAHLETAHGLHPTKDFVAHTSLLRTNGKGKNRVGSMRARVRKNEGQLEEPTWAPLPKDEGSE